MIRNQVIRNQVIRNPNKRPIRGLGLAHRAAAGLPTILITASSSIRGETLKSVNLLPIKSFPLYGMTKDLQNPVNFMLSQGKMM